MKEQMEYNVYLKNKVNENEHQLRLIRETFDQTYQDLSTDYAMMVESIDQLNEQNDGPTEWKNTYHYNVGDKVIYKPNGKIYVANYYAEAGKEPTVHNGIWSQFYPDWVSGDYLAGDKVYHEGSLYSALKDVPNTVGSPSETTGYWALA